MNRRVCRAAVVLSALAFAACSMFQTEVPPASVASSEENTPGNVLRENAVQVSAVVDAIDQSTRMVTLRGQDGETVSFRADESVRNLGQIKKGDVVSAMYYESIAVVLRKPGQATPGGVATEGFGRADVGAQPGAAGVRSVTLVATVRALDRAKQTATLESADGTRRTINVRNPHHFDVAAVGDLVEITYTEAVAISVEKP